MEQLAASLPPADLAKRCYALYEDLRPAWRGWGARSELSLEHILELARGGGAEA